jgi:cell division protein FtsN
MPKQDGKNDGAMKSGASRRSRAGRAGRGGNMPRIMILALLVIVAGGAALFWPRGGSVPTGIGENQTIVTSSAVNPDSSQPPRSGDVDINAEAVPTLTPEKEMGEKTASGAEAAQPAKSDPEPTVQTTPPAEKTPEPKPAARKPAAKSKTEPRVQPRTSGNYAVQVGAFGQAENADQEAARMKALGWDSRVRAGNNSSGEMVFRVWIVYFESRQEAQTFINQNSRHLAGAIPVHK